MIQSRLDRSSTPFHMNELLNGIPLNYAIHSGNHTAYIAKVLNKLNSVPNISALNYDQARAHLTSIITQIKTAIQQNPGIHIDNLNF